MRSTKECALQTHSVLWTFFSIRLCPRRLRSSSFAFLRTWHWTYGPYMTATGTGRRRVSRVNSVRTMLLLIYEDGEFGEEGWPRGRRPALAKVTKQFPKSARKSKGSARLAGCYTSNTNSSIPSCYIVQYYPMDLGTTLLALACRTNVTTI